MPDRQIAIRDVAQVSRLAVFMFGAVAGAVVTFVGFIARALALTKFNLELFIGSWIMNGMEAHTWRVGVLFWMLLAGLFAYGYAAIFFSARRSGALVGIQVSLIHWLISSVVAGFIPARGNVAEPGFFISSGGFSTALVFFFAHLVYGAVIGKMFDWAAMRDEYPSPLNSELEPA